MLAVGMEDENSLELSLGLFCGSSSSSKSKGNASELKIDDGGMKELLVGGLNASESLLRPLYLSNVDSSSLGGQQGCENFWKGLGQQTTGLEGAGLRYRQMWGLDEKVTISEDKLGQNKRKMPFEDVTILKKPEMGKEEVEARHNGGLKSHISVNSEDGSCAENEAVGESETEASNSWLMSQCKDVANDSETHNFSCTKVAKNIDLLIPQGKGSSNVLMHGPKIGHGSFSYGVLPSPGTGTAMPVKSPNSASASNAVGTHLSSVMQPTPVLAASEPSVPLAVKSNSLHVSSFGYQSAQLPTLETSSSWMLGSLLDGKSTTDAQPNASHSEDRMKAFQAMAFEGRALDPLKGSGKHAEDVGMPSSQPDEETDGNKPGFRPKLSSPGPAQQIEGFPGEGSVIRPGIAPGLKFGGCGSYPDLPWVSVTGSGPNGKAISGVTYKFSKNQIKIVCACHGSHMSPEEFIQHANADNPSADGNVGLAPFLNGNPAASAQS